MMGALEFMRRLEAAAEAFLTDPKGRQPGAVGVLRKTILGVEHHLTEEERGHLADQALGLLDPDVRGWVIVTVREHRGQADIDADIHIPAGAAVGVDCVLREVRV